MTKSEINVTLKVVDVHIHVGGKGNSSPCYMSPRFLTSFPYYYMVVKSGISPWEIIKDHDKALRENLLEKLNTAERIDFGVFLALDKVYDNQGNEDLNNTHMFTPNEYVMEMAKNNEKVLFGASVNPNKGELSGLKELDECIEGGAVLVKWIPNSQIIDPSDKKHEWFYRKLADKKLPLLCHTGVEHAVPVAQYDYQRFGNPRLLQRALDNGVTVIAAHCSAAGFPGEANYLEELEKMMNEAATKGWELYADISAMCSPLRVFTIDDILKHIPEERTVLGSDYPVPVEDMPPCLVETLDLEEAKKIHGIHNPFDKNYHQLLAMDFPESAMTRATTLLRIPKDKFNRSA